MADRNPSSTESCAASSSPLGQVVIAAAEQAACAAWPWAGKGDAHSADGAATAAMRQVFGQAPFAIRVVIGEGERDGAPLLARGERLGARMTGDASSAAEYDCAVDPLDGTSLLAKGLPGAMSAAVLASKGGLVGAPDFYMEKLACPAAAQHLVRLAQSPAERVAALSRALDMPVHALRIAVQDRPRHKGLAAALRAAGAQVLFFGEGDVAVALQAADTSTRRPYDALMGIGAAPEGVITAAAIRCMGAHFEGRFVYDPSEVMSGLIGTCRDTNRSRIKEAGIAEPDAHWSAEELVPARELVVALCGITGGPFVDGISQTPDGHLQTTTRVYDLGTSSFTRQIHLQQPHASAGFERPS